MKRIFAFLFLVAAASCIDPYTPNIKGYKSLLVVEGLITNENNSYKIKLSRTTSNEVSASEKITDAVVNITDEDGIKTHLQNYGNGYYKTDSTLFTGIIGKKYTLQIIATEGKEYRSEECTLFPVPGIDSVYYEKGEKISDSQGELLTGLKIFLNSAEAAGRNQYFRWTFEEVWKFIMPFPQQYIFHYIKDSTYSFESVPVVKDQCWKRNLSGEIITSSILPGGTDYINKQLIQFIAPVKSDRLTKQYSILIKQYSISKKEYDFWNNLKKVSEAGGNIFGTQPYTVISNIHNVNDINEMVLGYFEVSAVSQKRIYITAQELDTLELPHYKTDCVRIAKSPDDWPLPPPPRPTWNAIYHLFMDTGDYTFAMPEVKEGTILGGLVYQSSLLKLVFSQNACSICEYSGFVTKPDFWIDR